MFSKYYSLEEANTLIPWFHEEIIYLKYLQDTLHRTYRKRRAAADAGEEEVFLLEAAIDFLEWQTRDLIRQLETKYVFVRSVQNGQIDLPAKANGRTVMLSWKFGESAISRYRELFAVYTKRKRIEATDDDADPEWRKYPLE
ncbi:DUF2203 family protein [Marinococcus halophilus]|uniref:DUF2203 family protein n=1 Tax=Marinococcus halophilus TaxID=1371 RepID=UPI0009A914AA|nr:DUF2203 family protein [Marinococcus halophilus]